MQLVNLHFKDNSYRIQEAFKTLRTNIEFCGNDIKVIAVTSCTPNEGKSSVAMELSKAFAIAGNRTLLVDADMRKSVLVGRYKTGAVRLGLTHYLVGKKEIDDVICQTDIPNMYVIFSGPVPPNPSELIGGSRFTELIKSARKSFDYVIVDTPPLGSVIDSAVASNNCDGTILVIESNSISYKFAQSVKEQLDKSDCRTLGVVLNKVDMSGNGHYGRYYGKYYGKYYGNYGSHKPSAKVPNITPSLVETTDNDNLSMLVDDAKAYANNTEIIDLDHEE